MRVHLEYLRAQNLPDVKPEKIWRERFESIRDFERHLARNGTVIVKFFLHVSKKEQKKRFLERLDTPEKNWKYSAADIRERKHWNAYPHAYEDAIRRTATEQAPWYIVPADRKWFKRIVVAAAVIDALASLDLRYPELTPAVRREQMQVRRELLGS